MTYNCGKCYNISGVCIYVSAEFNVFKPNILIKSNMGLLPYHFNGICMKQTACGVQPEHLCGAPMIYIGRVAPRRHLNRIIPNIGGCFAYKNCSQHFTHE